MMSDTGEPDLYRDTWVRYLGYANEIGESFRPLVRNSIVRASYAVATAYTIADTGDKGYKMYQKDARPRSVLIETGDALIWQTLASIVIPGYVINRLCAATRYVLSHARVGGTAQNWISVGVGLISIPFIVHPIDDGTTLLMDETYRKVIKP